MYVLFFVIQLKKQMFVIRDCKVYVAQNEKRSEENKQNSKKPPQAAPVNLLNAKICPLVHAAMNMMYTKVCWVAASWMNYGWLIAGLKHGEIFSLSNIGIHVFNVS